MGIYIKEVKTKKDLRKFINLPAGLHRYHEQWIPSIKADDRKFFNPKTNRSFEYSDTTLAIAIRDGRTVGRIMGIINKRYNEIHKENHARFAFMDCENSNETSRLLVKHVADWAKEKKMEKLVGPLGFSDKDPQGFLIEGYEHRAVMETATNLPYMVNLIEKEGFIKKVDLNDYMLDIKNIPELFSKIFERMQKNSDFKIKEFNSTKELKPYIIPILQLMNDTFSPIYGFVPFTEKEMKEYAKRYLPVLDPNFIKVVLKGDMPVGFAIAMPDMAEGLKRSKGRLFPFGIFKIIGSIKKSKHLIMLLGAVHPDYRGLGIDSMLAVKIFNSANARGMGTLESHLVLETNKSMNAEYQRAGGEVFRKFRIYQKDLTAKSEQQSN